MMAVLAVWVIFAPVFPTAFGRRMSVIVVMIRRATVAMMRIMPMTGGNGWVGAELVTTGVRSRLKRNEFLSEMIG
jgi:hypothetical protein